MTSISLRKHSEAQRGYAPSKVTMAMMLVAGLSNLPIDSSAALLTASDIDDDATLTLSIEDTLLEGVNQQWGTVRIQVTGVEVSIAAGDSVDLFVFEDDLIGDDLLWQDSFIVTAAEVSAQSVDRTLPLIFTPLPDGTGSTLEIFAEGDINKDQCGFLCTLDNPITPIVTPTLAPVPVPAAAWLFGSALGLLGWVNRRTREQMHPEPA